MARFCSSCGTRLPSGAASPPSEERRLVTIVFADLAGFTQRSDQADPEDVRRTLIPFHALAKEEIERFGGTLDKFIGDAAMGVFGAPVAHEDDPERAVRAALAIRERVGPLQMPVRVAVNTGEAIVTFATGPQIGENVAGDVVNTASRLQGVAPIGGVVAGDATERATRRVVVYTPMEPAAVKGKAEPLRVWLAESMRKAAPERDEDNPPQFVGREGERIVLRDLLAGTERDRRVQLVTVVGEPGIGKSRLVADLADHVRTRARPVTWYRGRCPPYGESITFAALEEIVRAAVGIDASDDRAGALAKLRAEIAALDDRPAERAWLTRSLAPLVGMPDPSMESPSRDELFAAWTSFLASKAARYPLVLVVEDLHWADEAMLSFLEYLVQGSPDVPILVVATARPELFASSPSWGSYGSNTSAITLPPLDDEAMHQLLEASLVRSVLTAETREPLIERAGGNPLFALEFVRMLEDRSASPPGARGAGAGASSISVPDSVQALIAARLDALGPGQRSLLHDASVVGDRFWPGALLHLDPSSVDLDPSLRELQRRGMLRRSAHSAIVGEPEFGFSHALIRDVAYGQLPRAGRAIKHRAVATWLAANGGDRALDLAELLAFHAGRAFELATAAGMEDELPALRDEARRALVMAGERQQSLDPRRAADYYTQALALTDPGDPELAELMRLATLLSWRSGRIVSAEAVRSFRAALEVALAAGDRRTAARVMRRLYFQLSQQGDTSESHVVLDRAIALLDAEPDPGPLLAELYACRSEMEMFAGHSEDSLAWAEHALRLPSSLETTLMALHLKGNARCELGDLDGVEDLREAFDLSQDQGRALDVVHSTSYLAEWVGMIEGPHAALVMSDAALALCLRRGLAGQEMWTRAERLWLLYDAGRWDEILEQTDVLIGWGREHGDGQVEAAGLSYRARVLAQRGRVVEAAELAADVVPRARAIEDLQILSPALVAAAQVAGAAGDGPRALELLGEFDAATGDAPSGYRELLLPDAVRTCLAAGGADLARRLIRDRPTAHPPRIELAVLAGSAAIWEADGELDAAADAYGEAARSWSAWGGIPEQAHALKGRARTLRALGQLDLAREPASVAADLFTALGVDART